MSTTRAPTKETDGTTLQTQQWSVFTASQAAHQEQQMAAMRQQSEDCMRANSTTPLPAVIDTAYKREDRKRRRYQLSDGPEKVTKTMKFYKNCDHACWSRGYDVSKFRHSGNYKNKKTGKNKNA